VADPFLNERVYEPQPTQKTDELDLEYMLTSLLKKGERMLAFIYEIEPLGESNFILSFFGEYTSAGVLII
jgi:hypothetical protein